MKKSIVISAGIVLIVVLFISLFIRRDSAQKIVENQAPQPTGHPLSIKYMRSQTYPGSEIVIEETLGAGAGYNQFIASYKSEGLKQFALLTIPQGTAPSGGWPAIIFNHGYIPPEEYRTTERYVAYLDAFARNRYVVFKPDYRGHGDSEGEPVGAYYSPAYTIDVLNAVSSVKKLDSVNPHRIGMWGHSLGGHLTLRSMVVSKDIKAGVILAGVVGSYKDMIDYWQRGRSSWRPSAREEAARHMPRSQMVELYGEPKENPEFWSSISPIYFVGGISGPVQLHHATTDETVPVIFSEKLHEAMQKAGKISELYIYEGDDHNLSGSLNLALSRSVAFFDQYLK